MLTSKEVAAVYIRPRHTRISQVFTIVAVAFFLFGLLRQQQATHENIPDATTFNVGLGTNILSKKIFDSISLERMQQDAAENETIVNHLNVGRKLLETRAARSKREREEKQRKRESERRKKKSLEPKVKARNPHEEDPSTDFNVGNKRKKHAAPRRAGNDRVRRHRRELR